MDLFQATTKSNRQSRKPSEVSFCVVQVEGGAADTRLVSKYSVQGSLKHIETRTCSNADLDNALADLAPDFEVSMSSATFRSFEAGIDSVRSAVLEKKIDISGDFRKYSLIANSLPGFLTEISSQIPADN